MAGEEDAKLFRGRTLEIDRSEIFATIRLARVLQSSGNFRLIKGEANVIFPRTISKPTILASLLMCVGWFSFFGADLKYSADLQLACLGTLPILLFGLNSKPIGLLLILPGYLWYAHALSEQHMNINMGAVAVLILLVFGSAVLGLPLEWLISRLLNKKNSKGEDGHNGVQK